MAGETGQSDPRLTFDQWRDRCEAIGRTGMTASQALRNFARAAQALRDVSKARIDMKRAGQPQKLP